MTDLTPTLAAHIEALAACPFCGGEAEITLDAGRNTVGVQCKKCTANQTPSWDIASKAWAIRAWNTRPAIVTALRQAEAAPGVVEALRQALKDVCDPIAAMQRECPPGHELNHNAVTMGKCLQYIQTKAREALARQHGTREPGRPIGTAPPACSVLGGRFNESWGGWTFAVVNTPTVQPFTHWWPLPGFDDAEIVLLPAAPATDVGAG